MSQDDLWPEQLAHTPTTTKPVEDLEREIYELIAYDTIVDQHAKGHPILNAQDIAREIVALISAHTKSTKTKEEGKK